MKRLTIICCAWFLAACSFDPSGLPAEDVPDAGSDVDTDAGSGQDGSADLDAGAAPDAAWPDPTATIACTSEAIDGYPKIVLTFGGDIASGFLGADPGPDIAIDSIEYGSNDEDGAVAAACVDKWAVPYPSGCTKHSAVWGPAPRLILEPEVDELNVALHYHDGTIRWGDLKTSDLDSVGFTVTGLDCRIELVDGGMGGYIRTKP